MHSYLMVWADAKFVVIRTALHLVFNNAPVEIFKWRCKGQPHITTISKMKFVTTLHL